MDGFTHVPDSLIYLRIEYVGVNLIIPYEGMLNRILVN